MTDDLAPGIAVKRKTRNGEEYHIVTIDGIEHDHAMSATDAMVVAEFLSSLVAGGWDLYRIYKPE